MCGERRTQFLFSFVFLYGNVMIIGIQQMEIKIEL